MTDALTVARQETAESDELRKVPEEIRGLQIESDEDQEFAAEVLRDVKERHRALEEKRKSITQPLNKALREVNALFRPLRSALEEAEKLLKSKIADYQEEKARQNAARLAEASVAEDWQQAQEALAGVEEVRGPEGVSVRHTWKPVVTDARKVPRAFLSVDLGKLEAHAKKAPKGHEPAPVAGIRWEKKPIVTSRRT